MKLPPRAGIALAERGAMIAVALMLLSGLLIAGAGYVYTNPSTRTVTETTNQQSFTTETTTSAVVTDNTSLYQQGQTLTNMPVYLLQATPRLTITTQTSVPDDTTVQVSHRLVLVMEANRDGAVFFTRERALIETQHTVTNGTASDSATINVSAVNQEMDAIREELGGAGTLITELRLTTDYESDQYSGQLQAQSPLQISGGAYLLGQSLEANDARSESTTQTVQEPPDLTTAAGLGVGGIVGLGLAGLILHFRRQIDAEELRTARDHDQFSEWISEGDFPTAGESRFNAINSLEDLVDIAIDSDKRVIYDPEFEAYAVVDGDVVYYYAPSLENIDLWLDA